MKKLLLPFSLLITVSTSIYAQVIAYEGFDYPSTGADFSGDNGGSGWSGAWGISGGSPGVVAKYNGTSLSNGAFPFTTSGGAAANDNEANQPLRDFSGSIDLTANGEQYFSFLIRFDTDNTEPSVNLAGTGLKFTTSGVTGDFLAYFQTDGGSIKARAVGGSGTQAFSTTSYALDTTYFVAGKIATSASGSDTLAFSVYESAAAPSLEPVSFTVVSTGLANGGSLTGIQLIHGANGNNDGTLTEFDEIRFGDSWAAVAVPEPSSYGLLAGALALGWIMVRRRR